MELWKINLRMIFKKNEILEDNILKIRILEFWKMYWKIVFRKLDFSNFGKII